MIFVIALIAYLLAGGMFTAYVTYDEDLIFENWQDALTVAGVMATWPFWLLMKFLERHAPLS